MPRIAFVILLLSLSIQGWGQTQEQLEEKKAKLQQEIIEKQRLLNSVKSKEKSVLTQMIIQKDKIDLKEKVIKTTEKQARVLNDDIYLNQTKINQLNKDLDELKKDYAEMILKAYKSRSESSRAMFLLSSENFLQAYKRVQYMKQYSSFRKMQGEEIKNKMEELMVLNNIKETQKKEKEKLLAESEKEKQELEKEKQEQEKIAKEIKKDKNKITEEIRRKQKETKKIDAQIQRLIREAIAEANRKVSSTKSISSSESSSKIVLTQEGQLIANNFKANKGKLPWPVEKGALSLPYGDQSHPLIPSLTIHNSGVEITTEKGATARAVFGGQVTKVIKLSPLNIAVFIQHGDYFTVYQNLSSVVVSAGDKVSTKETLGTIRTNADTGKTVLKFLLLQNTTYNNPATWLYKM